MGDKDGGVGEGASSYNSVLNAAAGKHRNRLLDRP